MYEFIDKQATYTLPNGKTVDGNYFYENDSYLCGNGHTYIIDCSSGFVSSVLSFEAILSDYGIDYHPEDEDNDLKLLNTTILNNKKYDRDYMVKKQSILKVAQIAALNLTDEQAIEVPDLYPEYEVGHEYKQNDRFQYNGSLYKVNQAHTSQAQWVPGETGTESLYTNLMLNDAGYQIWKQPTGAHDAYNTGDVVEYKGVLYKSLIDGNAWAPDVYPRGWQEYDASTSTEPGTPEPGTPDPGTETYPDFVQPTGAHDAYKKGDIVRYNGKLYQSLIDANAYSPDAYPQGWQEYSEE